MQFKDDFLLPFKTQCANIRAFLEWRGYILRKKINLKKLIAASLAIILTLSLALAVTVSADEEHALFINRDGILFNGDVAGMFANHSSGDDEVDVEEYLGGTIEIAGWCVTDAEIQHYGYTVDGGEFVVSDYVNTIEADYNAIRGQMSKFEDAVDAARFWVKVPIQPGEHTIEVYLQANDEFELLWTVETSGGVEPTPTPDPNATEVPTAEPTEVPATDAPTEEPATEEPTAQPETTKAPEATEKGGASENEPKDGSKKNFPWPVILIVAVVLVAVIAAVIIISKRKKK